MFEAAVFLCRRLSRARASSKSSGVIAGLEVGGEAIDFLDDSTFVLTSEAGVTCGLSQEQRPQ